jgi:predicted nucleotidyltransferase
MQKTLDQITTEAKQALGENLVSLVLYGSHARGDAHERSDINLLLLVNDKSPQALRALPPVVSGWMKLQALPPVVFSAEQFRRSFDSFALEFAEIAAVRKVLAGVDPFLTFQPDWEAIRRELEHEARRKRIELHRRWLATGGNAKLYPAIIKDTLRGFLSVIRGTMLLENRRLEPITIVDALDELRRWPWFDADGWRKLRSFVLDGGNERPKEEEWPGLMDTYLLQAFALAKFLDEMKV